MRKKLGEILVASGAVGDADVEAALNDQSAGEPNRLGDLLVATGKITSTQLAHALAEQYELPYVDLPPLPQAVLDLVPLELQRQYRFVPLKSDGTELHIAMADLANVEVLAILEQQWTKVHVNVATGDEIDALHNTLSGIFKTSSPDLPSVAPSVDPVDDLFGGLELDAEPVLSAPSPVPSIAPVAPAIEAPRPSPSLHASASPGIDDLFGDLNLESERTGIPARPPDATPPPATELAPAEEEEDAVLTEEPVEEEPPMVEAVRETSGPVLEGVREVTVEPAEIFPEGSGPVLDGVREGTGPLLDMLVDGGGTGPVIDTPFFRDSSIGDLVPPMADLPFSSDSALARLALVAPGVAAPAQPIPASSPSSSGEQLPDWLKDTGPAAAVPVAGSTPGTWTGALDHLAPSKLVLGLTRALLARGLVTEEEILAALGQKK